ncbi:PaaI family thioesterase [Chachezhania antarctica]|uniref:PaaI family thioesterase n=1 Tax=Chachezhania antarctica TaxID=2340860 RepID=UPI000EAD2C62|nr:PaaI family thioesterase [Chachezhania antarctica]|tara:strand:- start:1162 stop:1566 length:405 start_codon:yes stop_codon:yes gene_type:complete
MTPDDLQTILQDNFADWVRALEPDVREAEPDHVLVRMPLGPHLSRVGGIVSGQALAALADTSMVLAAVAHAGVFKPLATTDLHTQFLRPGVGTAILCRAMVVRAGKALIFARAEMTEEDSGKMVATATATFFAP